ncbi:MAG TPA: HAMP domain-containing sensor histidine kinase [Streptosporangiaceae bacterium]|nr:HAMP domain-containing sensor histidine kinase [Streptosporangiaceae bacterium]
MKLSTRFALAVAVLVPLLVLLGGLVVVRLASQDLRAERDRQLVTKLHNLGPLANMYAQSTLRERIQRTATTEAQLTRAAVGTGGFYLQVPAGQPLKIGNVPDAGSLPALRNGPLTLMDSSGIRWRAVAAGLPPKSAPSRMWVVEPEARLTARLDLLRTRLLLATLIAVVVGAAAGFALGRVAGRPLAVLRRQALLIDTPPYEHHRLAATSGVTEIDELAGLVNVLLDRRDAAVQRTGEALETARAFAATAAHELRTPLTSMGTNLSLLRHPSLPADQLDEVVTDLTTEHARLQRLITILRQLAQAELLDPAGLEDADLAEIAGAAVEDARRRHPGVTVEVDLDDGVTVHGWADGLRMIADNLLENAVVHGGGVIHLAVRRDGPWALLSVQDGGPGIPEDRRHEVFDRFRKRPGSPGSGLGLTLVQQQAVLHQGSVAITGPSRFDVRLPLAGPDPTQPGDTRSWLASNPE